MRFRTAGGVLLGALLSILTPAVASAHHPVIDGDTGCTNGTWSVTWTVRADDDRDLTWQIVTPVGYTPAGSQGDELAFTRTVDYPASQAAAVETVTARWSNQVQETRTATVDRPPICEQPTTTPPNEETTTSTSSTTTTTNPTTSSSSTSTSTPDPTSTSSVAASSTTTAPTTVPAPTSPPRLPPTGSSNGPILAAASLLIGLGIIAMRVTRRV